MKKNKLVEYYESDDIVYKVNQIIEQQKYGNLITNTYSIECDKYAKIEEK